MTHELFRHLPPAAGHDESHPLGGNTPESLPPLLLPPSPKVPIPLSPPLPPDDPLPPLLLPPSLTLNELPRELLPHAATMAASASIERAETLAFPRRRMGVTLAATPVTPVRKASHRGTEIVIDPPQSHPPLE